MENLDETPLELSYAEVLQIVEEFGGKLETKEKLYKGANVPCSCRCPQNHKCRPYPYKILELGRIPCPGCIKGKTAHERFHLYFKEIGARTKEKNVKIGDGRKGTPSICPLDHDCNPSPCNVMKGQGMCDICGNRSIKVSSERYEKCLAEQECILAPDQDYKNNRTPLGVICKKNHLSYPIPANVMNGQGACRKCANQDPEESEKQFRHTITVVKKGKVIGKYINAITPVECLCPLGHTCYPTPNNIQKGQGMCETCRSLQTVSNGEKLAKEAMEIIIGHDNTYKIGTQFKPTDLKLLKYDLYITKTEEDEKVETIEMLIEFHGIQHEEEHRYYHKHLQGDKSTEAFLAARERDLAKIYYAAKKGYKLVVLDHTWTKNSIEKWVEYLREAFESDKKLISDSPLHDWVRNDKPSKETIKKYSL